MARRGTRRAVILGAAAVIGGFQLAPRLWDAWDSGFEFEPLDTPAGFRRLRTNTSSISAGQGLLVGLDPAEGVNPGDVAEVQADLCNTLFHLDDKVPVAAFSDYYCPYCRILDAEVAALAYEGLISLRHHETPIFGIASEWAAKGAIAARRQGKGDAYFQRMIQSAVRANPAYLRLVADDIGLDADQFASDMQADWVAREMRQSAALGRLFRFVGTPALVVGRTALQGAITQTNLRQLIDLEREQTAQSPCR